MMKKIYNISLIATSIFAFITWNITQFIDPSIFGSEIVRHTATALINLILAYGFFHGSASIIILLSNRFVKVKKLILGSSFIEGVWVGYTLGKMDGSDPRYIVQKIEQTIDSIIINVRSYNESLSLRTNTVSKFASIDASRNILIYITEARRMNELLFGAVYIEMHLINKGQSTPPERMTGVGTYLEDGSTRKSLTKKLSDLPHNYEYWQLIKEAKTFYDENFTIADELLKNTSYKKD